MESSTEAKSIYQQVYEESLSEETREEFWRKQAQKIHWDKFPEQILQRVDDYNYIWFKDGMLNICYNCVDIHAQENGEVPAIYYDSPYTNIKQTITYNQLLDKVSRLAGALRRHGVQKGDLVVLYMPNIPEAIYSMLACARIGAIHHAIYAATPPKGLAYAIQNTEAKLLITASYGYLLGKKVNYKELVDQGLHLANRFDSIRVLIVQREELVVQLIENRDYDFNMELNQSEPVNCVSVEANHPFYIMNTSGTTGKSKGIIKGHGVTAVPYYYSAKIVTNINSRDVQFAVSDVGWSSGQQIIVYSPLLVGATTILFEGSILGPPDAGVIWRIIQEQNVKSILIAPIILKLLKQVDPNGEYIKKYNLTSLEIISIGGEKSDAPTLKWFNQFIPQNILINDVYAQTEIPICITANFGNLQRFPVKYSSTCKPLPGMDVRILDSNNEICPPRKEGDICLKLPLLPGSVDDIYKNSDKFVETYLSQHKGYYNTGDTGYFDEEGYLYVLGRSIDFILVGRYVASVIEIEEVINSHQSVAECAVVGLKHEIYSEVPAGFIVLKNNAQIEFAQLTEELKKLQATSQRPEAEVKQCFIVQSLPKNRSGKVLRSILKKLVNLEKYEIPDNILDETAVLKIESLLKKQESQK